MEAVRDRFCSYGMNGIYSNLPNNRVGPFLIVYVADFSEINIYVGLNKAV